jgi:predicted signal transduction protein with EAL and GGDEF domain
MQNGYIESFNGRMRDELLNESLFIDLDHFKEFNDRYSYYEGDRVIRILAKILHDVVKGLLGPRGFVGQGLEAVPDLAHGAVQREGGGHRRRGERTVQ